MATKISKVQRSHCSSKSTISPTPISTPKIMGALEGGMPNIIARLYRHIFAGGTFDQLRQEDIIILILNPAIKKGTVKRKSAGTLYDRTIVYMDTRTGKIELRPPGSWGNIDLEEVKDAMDEMEKYRLI